MIPEKLNIIFSFLDTNEIKYYLLRPVSLKNKITDIDLVIPRDDFDRLIILLKEFNPKVRYKKSPYNHSIKLFFGDLILDIQFFVSFLPRKSLVIKIPPNYSSVTYLKEFELIIPKVDLEILFTFWTLRLFLDKDFTHDSNSFNYFKLLYKDSWESLITTKYFTNWCSIIFGESDARAKKILVKFFSTNFNDHEGKLNREMKTLVFKNNKLLKIKYLYDQLKFRVLRVFGKYSKMYSIEEY